MESALKSNQELPASLKQDPNAKELCAAANKDAALGRMTEVVPVAELDLSKLLLARRFCREQGVRSDGTVKYRAVDDESVNGINSCFQMGDTLSCDCLNQLAALIRRTVNCTGSSNVSLWKADIDSAYRRIPVASNQRKYYGSRGLRTLALWRHTTTVFLLAALHP